MRLSLLILVILFSCSAPQERETNFDSWDEILRMAENSEVTMMMWRGDPLINQFMEGYVSSELMARYGIRLNLVDGQGNYIVRTLMSEREAGASTSELDMIWINGETFYQLRQIEGLYGPFTDLLPNSEFVNWSNPFINTDFQQPVDGYEAPWGNVQLTLIYDQEQVPQPPESLPDMAKWVKENPGRFSIGNDFTGMTLLKSWMINLHGNRSDFEGPFDEVLYEKASGKLFDYLREIQPYLWNNGESFPESVAKMHLLFSQGELSFTMSNNDSEVDNKISQGIFPATARSYVPAYGTIQNSHYLGIPLGSGNKAGAMTVINFLLSPEAQATKMNPSVWGDHTVLEIDRVPDPKKFLSIPGRTFAPNRDSIQSRAIQEPAPEYMIRLFEDFREIIIKG